jgi:hypothetical protein
MAELFYLIDTHKVPTREDSKTIGRITGDDFIATYCPGYSACYGGYIVADGQLAPFWRFDHVPQSLMRNLYHLGKKGYIGRIERTY